MASLSRKIQLQQFSWQVLEDLVFCSVRWPRLAELVAQVRFEQQAAAPALPVDPAIEALIAAPARPRRQGSGRAAVSPSAPLGATRSLPPGASRA
jgi:hypothetical protein